MTAGIVVGIGARHGVSLAELRNLVTSALVQAGVDSSAIAAVATVDNKSGDEAIKRLAADYGVPLVVHAAERLQAAGVPNPSERVAAAVGTPSVAEAAALTQLPVSSGEPLADLIELLVPKTASPGATVAVARHRFDSLEVNHQGDAELADGLARVERPFLRDCLDDVLAP